MMAVPAQVARVFYDVNQTENLVIIVAVGKKKHNELWIGNEQVEL
jgi:hypothetical protein